MLFETNQKIRHFVCRIYLSVLNLLIAEIVLTIVYVKIL